MKELLKEKKITLKKGTLIAFEAIPKQIERDEINEEFGFESFYNLRTQNDEEKTKPCFIFSSNDSFYDK